MNEREVTLEMMQGFAQHIGVPESCVFQVSAKTGFGVNDMLQSACSVAAEKLGSLTPPSCECHHIIAAHQNMISS